MTDTSTVETPNPVRPSTLARKAAAAKRAAPPAPAPTRSKHPIVRTIPRGAVIDPEAIVTVNVPNPKVNGCKAWQRWEAGYASGRSVRATLAVQGGPTVGDLRYDFERRFIELDPAPAIPPKAKK